MTMQQIVLTDAQVEVIARATTDLEVRDPEGNVMGYLHRTNASEQAYLATVRRRLASDEPCYSTKEVLAHLSSLEGR
jgi:hypothetical protein